MQMSSFIRQGAGTDCWLAVPSCETSRGRLRVLTQLHSKHTGESCRSVMAEPWKLVSHPTHSSGQRSYTASPDSRREEANTFQREECQGIAAVFNHHSPLSVHKLTFPCIKGLLTLSPSPPPPKF